VYLSPERQKALSICEFDDTMKTDSSLTTSQAVPIEKNDIKSAMLEIFSFKYTEAQSYISHANILIPFIQNLQPIEDAAATRFYKKLAKHETNEYTRNCLWFLSGPSSYSNILANLSTLDSARFALKFLNDSELKLHLKNLAEKAKSEGSLDGLIITGFTQDTSSVLLNFYKRTDDLQTLSILYILSQQYFKSDLLDDHIKAYKIQLNRLELYHSRCLFEIEETRILNKKKDKGKCIRCYYCGNSIAVPDTLGSQGMVKRGDLQSVYKPFLNTCPSCSASLPRCSVCLSAFKVINPHFTGEKPKTQKNPADLFCWCENCHHGGHASHITEWFLEMTECPVYGCECRCNSLDDI
jgi:WD repeat-containing protein mio